MELLVVVLLVIFISVTGAAGLLGLSYGLGVYWCSREGARAHRGDTDPCAQCHADREWYESLPPSRQNLVAGWWLANRLACAARGCK